MRPLPYKEGAKQLVQKYGRPEICRQFTEYLNNHPDLVYQSASPISPHDSDNFLFHRRLDYGGNGNVFLMEHKPSALQLALKIQKSDSNHSALRRSLFLNEASWLERLEHPGIPFFITAGTVDLIPCGLIHFIAMEYVPGVTLHKEIHQEPKMRKIDIFRRVDQLLAIVGYLHDLRILHGDIKPGNILLDDERLVLLDFQSTKTLGADFFIGNGTADYLAPEISLLIHASYLFGPVISTMVGTYSDIYSIGASLYEMLSSTYPTPYISRTSIECELSEISPIIVSIVVKSLSYYGRSRFQNVAELRAALVNALCDLTMEPGIDASM